MFGMHGSEYASLIVAVLALLGVVATNRSARTASANSSRTSLETEAYSRARLYDTETIKRQAQEIIELRSQNENCKTAIEELTEKYDGALDEIRMMRSRVYRLERALSRPDDPEEFSHHG